MTQNLASTYRDLVPFRQFHRDTKLTNRVLIAIGRQKMRHRDADGNLIKPQGRPG
jgi:hypothetical protein